MSNQWHSILTAVAFGLALDASAAVMFDFDTFGTPALNAGATAPFSQSSDGILASFTTSSGYSIQTEATFGWTLTGSQYLSKLSGNFLNPSNPGSVWSILDITFDQSLTSISFDFATTEPSPIETPTSIRLTAYSGAATVGTITATGVRQVNEFLPEGTLNYSSATAFDRVEIIKVHVGGGGLGVMVDNLSVTPVPEPATAAIAGLLLLGLAPWLRRRQAQS